MNYKYYKELINDSVCSVERLNRIYGDLQCFLESDYVERKFTKKYDENLRDLFDKSLLTIADILVEMDNKEFFNNPDKNIVCKGMDILLGTFTEIAFDLEEMMTNENFHREYRILENEPSMIWYNLNEIKNEIL